MPTHFTSLQWMNRKAGEHCPPVTLWRTILSEQLVKKKKNY